MQPVYAIQVLRHLGRTDGQDDANTGAAALEDTGDGIALDEETGVAVDTGAIHLVQIVETLVEVIVDTVRLV